MYSTHGVIGHDYLLHCVLTNFSPACLHDLCSLRKTQRIALSDVQLTTVERHITVGHT